MAQKLFWSDEIPYMLNKQGYPYLKRMHHHLGYQTLPVTSLTL